MKKYLMIFCLLFCLTACGETINKETTYLGYLTDAENMIVPALNTEVYLTTVKDNYREQMVSTAQEQIFKYHMLLDSHHDYLINNELLINVKYLNEHIGQGPIVVDEILIDMFDKAINLSQISHGYFNPSIGEISECYQGKFLPYESINTDPNSELLNNATYIPYDQLKEYIIIDKTNNTIELKQYNDKDYVIDFGAIAKGYTLDNIIFEKDSSYLITAGASSISTYSNPNEEVDWNIGIKTPDSNEMLFSINLNEGSISTSGDDENFYLLEDGTRRHHIINPFSAHSENYYRNITLISNNATVADALSTAFFSINDIEEIEEIISVSKETFNCSIDYCFMIEEDTNKYSLIMSDGFNNIMNNDVNDKYIERIEVR